MKKSNLTIKDIARISGYSKTTVSRVINQSVDVKPQTRDKILSVIDKYNYFPSAAARNLPKQGSSIVGVVVPQIDNPFFGEVLRGVTEIIDKNDLTLICCNTDDNKKKDLKALEMLKNHRVKGLIYTPAVDYKKKMKTFK